MAHRTNTLRDGLVVGAIGFVAVAGLYTAFDFLAARGPLYTVDLLGKAMFRGMRDPAVLDFPIPYDPSTIAMYNGLHLLVSLAIGLIVVRLVQQAERRPDMAPLMTLTIVAGFVLTIAVVGALTGPMRAVLPWWSIVIANSLAVLFAGGYLLRTRPGTWRLMMGWRGPGVGRTV